MEVRRFDCPGCGAPRDFLEAAVVALCPACGAFSFLDTAALRRGAGLADLRDREVARLVRPDRAQARRTVLLAAMDEAAKHGDRARWEACAAEFYALQAVLDPWILPRGVDTVRDRGAWLRDTVAAASFQTFHAAGRAAAGRLAAALGRLGRGTDPVGDAREILADLEEIFEALFDHPDFPVARQGSSARHWAREMLRSALSGAEVFCGPAASRRIRTALLGDTVEGSDASCDGCGAPLPAPAGLEGGVQCLHCGAVTVREEDPWMESTLSLFEAVRRDLARRERLRGTDAVLGALATVMGPFWAGGTLDPRAAYRFLARAIPWMDRTVLLEGIGIYGKAFEADPAKGPFLRSLETLASDWSPWGEPPPAPPPLPDAAPDDEGAWVEQALAMVSMTGSGGGDPSDRLLGMILTPFHLESGVTVRQALAFLAGAGCDATAVAARARALAAGYSGTPRIASFLEDLARSLEGAGDRE